ncbi:MAG: hypothetical protein HPY58_12705 [Firmicutes bacterium]|nr:hypothetical protein [Bacillota bacterium]
MIRNYLNQTAVWKRVVSYDGYPPVPEEPGTVIRVRWEAKRRLVRDRQGQEVVSEAQVYCVEPVQPGDVLNYAGRDWPVITVSEVVDLDGVVQYREVAV